MARVENQRSAVQWDPFFGPPVRIGDGGMGWKTDKDPRSKMPNGGLGQLPDAQRSLMPNEQLRHYGVAPIQQQQYMTQQYAPPGQPYQQQAYYGAQGAPYYQGPPPQMLQANPSFYQQPNNQPYGSPLRPGGAPAYVPAPQHYYAASGQPPQAAYYAAPQQQAHADPANTLGLSVAPREDPVNVFEFGVTPRQESEKAKLSEEELNSVLRTDESDDSF